MLHREKKSLYAVKNLLTKFRGDDAFIPCGSLNIDIDDLIFDIKPIYSRLSPIKLHLRTTKSPRASPHDKEKLNGILEMANGASDKNISGSADGWPELSGTAIEHDISNDEVTKAEQEIAVAHTTDLTASQATYTAFTDESGPRECSPYMAMEGIETMDAAVGPEATVREVAALNEEQTTRLNNLPSQYPQQDAYAQSPSTAVVESNHISETATATDRSPRALPSPESLKDEHSIDTINDRHDTPPTVANGPTADEEETNAAGNAGEENIRDESQPAPRRMRTRAQAQAASDNSASSHTRTPSPASWVPPVIHPLYLMPESARLDRDLGLPPNEAEDTRRLLVAFVQKQEEVVRGAEKLYEGLLRADRMRQTVFKWCKAEGHIGEMSDGEDWYDKEEWGLEEDLKKGHDDEEEDTTTQGKKTRKTRQQ